MARRTARIVFSSLAGFVQRGAATLGTLLIFPYVLRHVGLEGFALWGVAASLAMIINFADFGLGPMIINTLARALADGDIAAARRLFGAASTMAILIALMLILVAPLIYRTDGAGLPAQVYAIVALGVGINVPLGLANPMWVGMQKGWMMALWEFVQTLLFVGGLYLCGLWSSDVRVFALAIYLAIVASNLCNMAALLACHPEMRPPALPAPWSEVRSIVAPSAKFFSLTALDALTYLLDVTIALQAAGPRAAAQMAVVQRMAVAVAGLVQILAQYQWPHHLEAWIRRDVGWMARALGWSALGIATLALGIMVVLGAFGPELCRIWLQRDIGFHATTFGWLAAWILTLGTARLLSTALSAMNVLGFQMGVFGAFIIVSLGMKLALASRFGVDGILLGIVIPGACFLVPALVWKVVGQMRHAETTRTCTS